MRSDLTGSFGWFNQNPMSFYSEHTNAHYWLTTVSCGLSRQVLDLGSYKVYLSGSILAGALKLSSFSGVMPNGKPLTTIDRVQYSTAISDGYNISIRISRQDGISVILEFMDMGKSYLSATHWEGQGVWGVSQKNFVVSSLRINLGCSF